jgi:hypothetical protein
MPYGSRSPLILPVHGAYYRAGGLALAVQWGSCGLPLFPFPKWRLGIPLRIHFPFIEHGDLVQAGEFRRDGLKIDRSTVAHCSALSCKSSHACGGPGPDFSTLCHNDALHGALAVERPIGSNGCPVRAHHGGFDAEYRPTDFKRRFDFRTRTIRRKYALTSDLPLEFTEFFPSHSSLLCSIDACYAHCFPRASKPACSSSSIPHPPEEVQLEKYQY